MKSGYVPLFAICSSETDGAMLARARTIGVLMMPGHTVVMPTSHAATLPCNPEVLNAKGSAYYQCGGT